MSEDPEIWGGVSNLSAKIWLKSELKGQIVSKFDLGLLNAYNPMYFNIMSAVMCLV